MKKLLTVLLLGVLFLSCGKNEGEKTPKGDDIQICPSDEDAYFSAQANLRKPWRQGRI